MNHIANDILMHYGIKYRSGRYPYGSGENPYQHSGDFLSRIKELESQGMSEAEIAKDIGITTTSLRAQKSLALAEQRGLLVDRVKSLAADGLGPTEIGRIVGRNESTIRSLLNAESEDRMRKATKTADFLRGKVDELGMIDVGVGVEKELGISKEKMKQALEILKQEGYVVYKGGIPQATNPGRQTNMQVLCPPGTQHKDIYDFSNVHAIGNYTSRDNGETFKSFEYPASMDSKRIKIRYAEDGGLDKDGLVEIRRGVADLSLGNSHYAQVRILVDGKKYIKGMAVYSDDLPDGVDLVFNTNKKKGTPKESVLKDISDDPNNPFGSLIKANGQSTYFDKNGKEKLSLINKRAEEGDWMKWRDGLPSQFLSKQSLSLAKKQLTLTKSDKISEFDTINSLTNPTIKKILLESFADGCDSAAVHLQAASLPRQKYQVILPIPSLKDNECYAPNFRNGEKVALIRFPHGGTFEIPILTVNNKHAESKKVMGSNPLDAIGINSTVAGRLSGADFDGDTVMVIPTGRKINITSTKPLAGLVDFDPKDAYGTTKKENPKYTGKKGQEKYLYYNAYGDPIKVMRNTQNEMGRISNLITDMTIKGADDDELARAVRHSMVVIDAEKHKLDYKKSEVDNGIAALKKKYQGTTEPDGKYHEGASTIISKAKSETEVLKRQGQPKVNLKGKDWYDPSRPEGALIYKSVREEYTDKSGKTKVRTQKSTKMMDTDDAYTLVSDYDAPMERLYADYANSMKALANQARKQAITTPGLKYSKTAKATYQAEVKSLNDKLNEAMMNAPRERQAQRIANSTMEAKKKANPDMTKEEAKKLSQQTLNAARVQVGAKRNPIEITDKEWEAIQAGAISDNKLRDIANYADTDKLKERAMPRQTTTLSPAKISKIASMKTSGYTNEQIAQAIGVSRSTVTKYLNGSR